MNIGFHERLNYHRLYEYIENMYEIINIPIKIIDEGGNKVFQFGIDSFKFEVFKERFIEYTSEAHAIIETGEGKCFVVFPINTENKCYGYIIAGEIYRENMKFQNILVVLNCLRDFIANYLLNNLDEDILFYDSIAGIQRKKHFNNRLQQRIDKKSRALSILFLSISNLKRINKNFGYDLGDKVVIEIISRIKRELNMHEYLFNWDEDEFIILLPCTEIDYISNKIDKILKSIRKPYKAHNKTIHLFVNIGVSLHPKDGLIFEDLVKKADIAMEFAKKSDKNTYLFFNDNMLKVIEEKANLETDLIRAIFNGEFILYYQPIFSLSENKIVGVEALIRWNHPDKGIILPMEFIPFAEETGLINEIGKWVIKESFLQSSKWEERGYKDIWISINISSIQLKDSDFFKNIQEMLIKFGTKSSNIKVEITESIIMNSYEQAIGSLTELNKIGIDTTLDDFGTGYSSLSHLKNLPINTLKIDKSFIQNIHSEERDRDIVEGIINLGHRMNMKVVAEGVEETHQLRLLKKMGCDAIQGYILGKPGEASWVETLFK